LLGYISEDGILIKNVNQTLKYYFCSADAILDISSTLPLDLLYFAFPEVYPAVRLNRMLRWRSVTQFFSHMILTTKWVNISYY